MSNEDTEPGTGEAAEKRTRETHPLKKAAAKLAAAEISVSKLRKKLGQFDAEIAETKKALTVEESLVTTLEAEYKAAKEAAATA